MRSHQTLNSIAVPRDFFSPLARRETFGQRDFWRRFERIVVRELAEAHAQGVRGIRCAESTEDYTVEQLGDDARGLQLASLLRGIAQRTQARWVASLTETRIHLVHGPEIELESELVDGAWYHQWHHRVSGPLSR